MNKQDACRKWLELNAPKDVLDEYKRLERGKGSERQLVTPERSAGVTSGAEKRSEEDIGVTPVEARAAVSEKLEMWRTAAALERSRARDYGRAGRHNRAAYSAAVADTLFYCAKELGSLLPEPESEPERSDGERRRNVKRMHPY